MKKPCREEKQGLKPGTNKFNFFLLSFLFIYELNAQTPINGFCKLNSYKITADNTSIFSFNFNSDSYSDILLYNKNSKKYSVIPGNGNDKIISESIFQSAFYISSILSVYDNDNNIAGYAFVSRKNREAGFVNFSSSGKLNINKSSKFDSFPEKLSASDLNGDGKIELLISGNAFDGLSVISFQDGKPTETKPESRKIFSESVLIDLSNNGVKDIAAFDLVNRSINFYYNYGSLRFGKSRSIQVDGIIYNLKAVNQNLDNYEDLMYIQDNKIKIMYGDAVSAYSQVISIETKYNADKFITGDFNRDGKIDIAYINISKGILSVLFSKDEYEFYDEIVYLKRNTLNDIIPYYSKFINGLAVISSSGELITVTNLSSVTGDANLVPAIEPAAINYFDTDNNGINDICFIDNYDRSLKFIIRNSSGIPQNYFALRLGENHKEIKVLSLDKADKIFYCYSEAGRLIEIISLNFKSYKKEVTSLYSPGNISDLRVVKNEENEPRVYLSYGVKDITAAGYYEYKNFRYSFIKYPAEIPDVYSMLIALNANPEFYYWQQTEDGIHLNKKVFSEQNSRSKHITKIPSGYRIIIKNIAGDILNTDSEITFNLVQTGNDYYSVLNTGKNVFIKSGKEIPVSTRIKEKKQLYFGEIKSGGLKKIAVYFPDDKVLKKIDFTNGGRSYIATKILEAEDVDRFFIKNMNSKNYHFVYSNSTLGCITIKQLP